VLDRPLSADEDDTMRWLEGREGERGGDEDDTNEG